MDIGSGDKCRDEARLSQALPESLEDSEAGSQALYAPVVPSDRPYSDEDSDGTSDVDRDDDSELSEETKAFLDFLVKQAIEDLKENP